MFIVFLAFYSFLCKGSRVVLQIEIELGVKAPANEFICSKGLWQRTITMTCITLGMALNNRENLNVLDLNPVGWSGV